MKNKIILLFILNIFLTPFYYAQEFGAYNVKGEIILTQIDDFVTLRAQVLNEELFFINDLSYLFVVLKKGRSGNLSKNNQSNEFSLKPNEEKQLSTIKINLKKEEELRVYLFIKYKGNLIHRDTLFLSSNGKVSVKKAVNEEQYLIKGIVIDEAMTKIGKDYHDFFYKEYLVTGKNYPFIIKIVEKPAMGRSSIISIEVDRKKIHEFFARPEEDYLKTNVVLAMRKLRAYNQQRKTTFQNKF